MEAGAWLCLVYTIALMISRDLLPTTQKVEKIIEFVSESIPKFISII
jgi:hypothetical protein